MTESEEIAIAWAEKELGVQFERNGWPDCWGIDPSGRPITAEIKYKGSNLTDQQLFIRNLLIKADVHYLLIMVDEKFGCKIVFDSDKHKINPQTRPIKSIEIEEKYPKAKAFLAKTGMTLDEALEFTKDKGVLGVKS